MHTSSLWAKVLILAMTCLLTASCADFFKDSKSNNQNPTNPTDPNKPTTGGDNDPSKPSDPSLPEEFKNVNEGAFSEQKMLINIGANVMTPAVNDFAIKTPALKKSIATLCQSLSEGSSAKIETLQAQLDWEKAMMAFHEVQAAPLGPLMDRGRFLNDYLYSWPYLNTCAVDKKVYENSERPQAGNALMFNERGLFAIEYLIFEKSLRSNCNLRAHPQMKIWNE